MTSTPQTFRLRNESDIFNVSTAMSQIEINRPQKKYNIRLNNIDNINKFINKPNLSKAEKFQKRIKNNLSESNLTSTKASSKVYNSNNEKNYKLNRVKSENNYFPKYKNDMSPFQRKIIEIYGNDETKIQYIKSNNIKSSKGKIEREIKNINQQRKLSQSLTSKKFNQNSLKQSFDSGIKENKKFNINSSSKQNKMNSLKSNIFFLPNFEKKNNNFNLELNQQSLTDRIQTSNSLPKKVNYNKNEDFTKLNKVFDWKDSSNEIWLRRYYNKDKNNILNHRERKLRDLNGSMDDKNLNYKQNTIKNLNMSETDIKKNKIDKVKKFYKGKSDSIIQKQISNISVLSQDELYENNLFCANKNDKKNNFKNEICHSYSIENVKYEDIPEIKKLLKNNGIHIIKTLLNGYTLTGDKKGKMIIKIRENKNDKLYNQHLKNASNDILKNVKGISIINDEQIKKEIKLVPNFPANVNWQYSNNYLFSKNRLEQTNNPQISRKKGKFNRSNQIEYSKMLINKNKNSKK